MWFANIIEVRIDFNIKIDTCAVLNMSTGMIKKYVN